MQVYNKQKEGLPLVEKLSRDGKEALPRAWNESGIRLVARAVACCVENHLDPPCADAETSLGAAD
jgi:hypothetical protein